MAGCADDKQFGLEILGKVNNVAYGMPRDDMGVKLDMTGGISIDMAADRGIKDRL